MSKTLEDRPLVCMAMLALGFLVLTAAGVAIPVALSFFFDTWQVGKVIVMMLVAMAIFTMIPSAHHSGERAFEYYRARDKY